MPMFLRHRCTSPPLFVHSPRFPPPCPCPYPTGAVTTTVMITTTTAVLRVESHAWKGFAPLASYSLNGPILSPRLDFTTTVSCKRTFPLPSRTPPIEVVETGLDDPSTRWRLQVGNSDRNRCLAVQESEEGKFRSFLSVQIGTAVTRRHSSVPPQRFFATLSFPSPCFAFLSIYRSLVADSY